eukprot:TRINITY_DN1858_c1_g1_i1.p1 TRINITY_DN1858_c1_g1~~TRINITY_DN1858_c1_g1_i1.p1  ORF type:complete len:136 (-),score=33.54 TRINITY_DN1858_c1_g1_i1:33-419(-)
MADYLELQLQLRDKKAINFTSLDNKTKIQAAIQAHNDALKYFKLDPNESWKPEWLYDYLIKECDKEIKKLENKRVEYQANKNSLKRTKKEKPNEGDKTEQIEKKEEKPVREVQPVEKKKKETKSKTKD